MRGLVTLRRQSDLDRVFRAGAWQRRPEVAVGSFRRDDDDPARVAFVAGRRIGRAVRRNRARRRLRAAYRLLADRVSPGVDLVLVARDRTCEVDFRRLQTSLESALGRAGLLVEAGANDR